MCSKYDIRQMQTRSYNMSQVKSKDTMPELLIRKFLFSRGFRYKLHDPKLPGRPDIVLPKLRTVIFVNGCFWHGHENCRNFVVPKTRTDFWINKIQGNKTRDAKNIKLLKGELWNVIVIYECELKGIRAKQTLINIIRDLKRLGVKTK
jgi:DNA mismatch endonuclease (patch repair protein)